MNKHILLSLLIMSPVFVQAMENESSFSSYFSLNLYLPTWFSPTSNQDPNESQLITDLRKNKSDFEGKLRDKKVKRLLKNGDRMTIQPFSVYNITIPNKFLQYCYYLKFHKNMFNVNLIELGDRTLSYCQKAQLDGYSAWGASIISDNTSPEEKRSFIQELINMDFKPTSKDIGLAKLILYDGIAKHQITMLHLLRTHSQANWSVLPQEVREQIAQYMLQLFKKEFWPLPEKSLNNL